MGKSRAAQPRVTHGIQYRRGTHRYNHSPFPNNLYAHVFSVFCFGRFSFLDLEGIGRSAMRGLPNAVSHPKVQSTLHIPNRVHRAVPLQGILLILGPRHGEHVAEPLRGALHQQTGKKCPPQISLWGWTERGTRQIKHPSGLSEVENAKGVTHAAPKRPRSSEADRLERVVSRLGAKQQSRPTVAQLGTRARSRLGDASDKHKPELAS